MLLPKKRTRAELIASIQALRDEYNRAFEEWKKCHTNKRGKLEGSAVVSSKEENSR